MNLINVNPENRLAIIKLIVTTYLAEIKFKSKLLNNNVIMAINLLVVDFNDVKDDMLVVDTSSVNFKVQIKLKIVQKSIHKIQVIKEIVFLLTIKNIGIIEIRKNITINIFFDKYLQLIGIIYEIIPIN